MRWLPPAWIPNTAGTAVELLMVDGSIQVDRVIRGIDGLHRLETADYSQVKGWREVVK